MRPVLGPLFITLLITCATACADKTITDPDADPDADPIGSRFFYIAGLSEGQGVEMYRADAQIELREHGKRSAIGTLTSEGLSNWEQAVASLDPALVSSLHTCAGADGIDVCFDVEHESGPLQVCHCGFNPPDELAQFNSFFTGLSEALRDCQSSSDIAIDECES